SPSIASTGPGGWVVASTQRRNSASSAAGGPVAYLAAPLAVIALKLNPAPARAAKNLGGVILAVAIMCPRASRTDQSPHSDAAVHCCWVSVARSSASAVRSLWINGQGLDAAMAPLCCA